MKIQHKIIGASIIIGVYIWIIDTVLDFFFFHEGSFLEVLVYDVHPHHLYIRVVGIISFLIFGIIIAKVIALRKKTEEELTRYQLHLEEMVKKRTSELIAIKERVTTILESIHDGFFSLNNQLEVTYFNKAAEKLVGRKSEEVIGYNLFEAFPEYKGSIFEEKYSLAVKEQKFLSFETYFDVKPYANWYEVRVYPFKGGISVYFQVITTRKQLETMLKIKESAIASSINGIAFTDLEGKLTYVNDSFLRMIGYDDAGKVLGKSFAHFDVDEDKVLKMLEVIRKKGSWIGETIAKKKEGSPVNLELVAHMVKDDDGNPICMMTSVLNITERKKAEQLLKKSETQYKTLVENSHDLIFVVDVKANFIFTNKAFKTVLGYSSKEINLINGFELVHPDDLETIKKQFTLFLDGEIQSNMEYRYKQKKGSYITMLTNGVPLLNPEGKVYAVLGIARDITDYKKVKKALQQSEKNFRLIAETIQDVFWIGTPDVKEVFYVSPAFEKIWGQKREDIYKFPKLFIETIHPEDREKVLKVLFKEFKKHGGKFDIEFRIIHPDGTIRWIHDRGFPITNSNGNIVKIIGIATDITMRKRLEKELHKMDKLEAVGVLAGGIAHDFNNLLTAILGNLSLAEFHVKPGDKVYETLMRAKNASRQAGKLTQQLLTFSKGGAPVKETASISELIKETATFALRGSRLKCEYSFADNLWLAEIDKGQISQVIHNLIINADHAMPNPGMIRIDAKNVTIGQQDFLPMQEGKYIKISVKDKGSGILKEHLPKVFDPYFTTKENGSGLGLASCFSIIKNHRGHITVESEQGVETIFHIYLPASEKELFEVKEMKEEKSYIGHGKILFMDDEQNVIETATEMLTQLGYEVETAKTGTKAVEMYKKAREAGELFDVVILDLTIPGEMGGKEAIRKLSAIDPHIKAIVSSGYSNDPVMSEYMNYGFHGVVAKPYEVKELSKVLYKVINRKEEYSIKG